MLRIQREQHKITTLYIDSSDVVYPPQSKFVYAFKQPIMTRANESLMASLVYARIPYSFYNIRDQVNNFLNVTTTSYDGTLDVSRTDYVTITPGNYNIRNICETLSKKIQTLFTLHAVPRPIEDTLVSYSKITGKVSFKIEVGTGSGFAARRVEVSLSPLMIELGCVSLFNVDYDAGVSSVFVAPNVAVLNSHIHSLHLKTSLATSSIIDSRTGTTTDTFAIIPITVNPGMTIYQTARDALPTGLIHTPHIDHVAIHLCDNNGETLDLNGRSFSIGIQFRLFRHDNVIYPSLKPPDTIKRRKRKNKNNNRTTTIPLK